MSDDVPILALHEGRSHLDFDSFINCSECEVLSPACIVGFSPKPISQTDLDTLKYYRHLFFHSKCKQCPHVSDEVLCASCKHLRLGHVVHCAFVERDSKDKSASARGNSLGMEYLHLEFGKVRDLQQRAPVCGFCRLLLQTLESDHRFDPTVDGTIRICIDPETEGSLYNCGADFNISLVLHSGQLELYNFHGLKKAAERNSHLLQPEPEPEVNWPIVSDWLHDCCINHEKNAHNHTGSNPVSQFRVIDVEQACVMLAPPHCVYATLSYVWGYSSERDLSATMDNIKDLEKRGFLLDNPLPATIQDAMVACSKLGIRYLWTDRLCIIQDAIEEKMIQINAMDAIYSYSIVTLVALAGKDAHYGMPGVTKMRSSRPIFRTQGLYLIRQAENYNSASEAAKWSSRGWTYQEAVLSPRLLFFSDYGAYFECCHELCVKDENSFVYPNVKRSRFKRKFFLDDSRQLVRQYTQRDLTFKTDILHAFAGILNAQYGTDHHFGIPLHDFDSEILWVSDEGAYEPRDSPRDGIFPSWAWCSADTATMYYDFQGAHEVAAPLALWAIASKGKGLRLFQYESPDTWQTWDDISTQYASLAVVKAWQGGCYPGLLPAALDLNGTWNQIRTLIMSTWPSLFSLCKAAHAVNDDDIATNDSNMPFARSCVELGSKPGRLLVSTQSIRLPMNQIHPMFSKSGFSSWCKKGSNGLAVWMGLDITIWDEYKEHSPNAYLDVIALSLGTYSPVINVFQGDLGELLDEDQAYWRDSEGRVLGMDTLETGETAKEDENDPEAMKKRYGFYVNVMIIKTEDGISKRVDIGKTFLDLWIKQKPEFKTFVLE